MPGPTGAIELGKYLYLFKADYNKIDCFISAHGGFYKENRTFQVDGCTVYFYAAHRNTLKDPGIEVMSEMFRLKVIDSYGDKGEDGRTCVDYLLSKYQNSEKTTGFHEKHSKSNETYTSIRTAITDEERKFATTIQKLQTATGVRREALANTAVQISAMNVMTIRNRYNKADIKLSYAIQEARNAIPTLKNFHCSFCRSLIGDKHAASSSFQFKDD
jgi:hypothetical protein